MKCQMIIDREREEAVLLYVHENTAASKSLKQEIDALLTERDTELIGYGNNEILRLSPKDISCFTVEDGKVYALTDIAKLQIRQRLYVLEKCLGPDFIKINQSCIANIKKIERFDTSFSGALMVQFKNKHRDYVSRRQLKAVKERIGFKL